MEMPSLALPRRRAGDPTYKQQLQLDVDIAELPDDKGWSGLTRMQVCIGCIRYLHHTGCICFLHHT